MKNSNGWPWDSRHLHGPTLNDKHSSHKHYSPTLAYIVFKHQCVIIIALYIKHLWQLSKIGTTRADIVGPTCTDFMLVIHWATVGGPAKLLRKIFMAYKPGLVDNIWHYPNYNHEKYYNQFHYPWQIIVCECQGVYCSDIIGVYFALHHVSP